MNDHPSKDALYARPLEAVGDFVFDKQVAGVFDDMITRSVPGYRAIITMIGHLAEAYAQENSACYDLGCSLGAASRAMAPGLKGKNCRLVAVDNSQAMITQCRKNLAAHESGCEVEVLCEDIRDVTIERASVVVLNFTLQFIPPEEREALIGKIYEGLLPGGILLISEKITFEDAREAQFQDQMHRAFKKLNGYSDLEIAQKRSALENILIPDTLGAHRARLEGCGFKEVHVWFRCFNFAALVALR